MQCDTASFKKLVHKHFDSLEFPQLPACGPRGDATGQTFKLSASLHVYNMEL